MPGGQRRTTPQLVIVPSQSSDAFQPLSTAALRNAGYQLLALDFVPVGELTAPRGASDATVYVPVFHLGRNVPAPLIRNGFPVLPADAVHCSCASQVNCQRLGLRSLFIKRVEVYCLAMSYKPYISASLDHLHMRPVLPLGNPLAIGDVVTIDRGTLHPIGTVQDLLGVPLGETLPPERKISTTLRSGRGVSARLLAKGEASELFPAAPSAKVRLEVSMEGTESCLALVTEPTITRLKNPHALFPAWSNHSKRTTTGTGHMFSYTK